MWHQGVSAFFQARIGLAFASSRDCDPIVRDCNPIRRVQSLGVVSAARNSVLGGKNSASALYEAMISRKAVCANCKRVNNCGQSCSRGAESTCSFDFGVILQDLVIVSSAACWTGRHFKVCKKLRSSLPLPSLAARNASPSIQRKPILVGPRLNQIINGVL